jgi:phosphohistidine phosphatase SixA
MNQLRLFTALALVSLVASHTWAQESQSTTWLIVRHADRAGEDDAITPAGEQRAEQLAQIAKLLRAQAVYSTDFQRTRRTAEPTAKELNLEVNIYGDLNDDWFKELKSRHAGQVVLIVGHSNTAGKIVNGLGATGNYPIADDVFDNLFVVTTDDSQSTAVQLKYGEPVGKQ